MLKRFELRNYKNFKDPIVIDFSNIGGYQFNQDCITDNCISKMLVYGRNATGKTNLGSAITDIAASRFYLGRRDSTSFINADSDYDYATFDYTFSFDRTEIRYVYDKYSLGGFKSEKLSIDGSTIFDFDYSNDYYDHTNLNLISAETIIVERFLESLISESHNDDIQNSLPSFLRWLFANSAFSSDSLMAKLMNYINRMAYLSVSTLHRSYVIRNDRFIQTLEGKELQQLEDFFNAMGVQCELENKRLPDGENQLYFKHKQPVPFFETASSGTFVLFNLYRRIVTRVKSLSFLYLDEFDAFFHYEMSERFLKYLKTTFPECQIVLTTHNTNLMTNRLMRPDCVFILTQSREITPLNRATTRELREGHNLEKLYMSGEFDG